MKKSPMQLEPGIPKYRAVAQQLEDQIADETYRIGDRLPSERELAAEWGITAMTVRQAMELLREKSLIVRRQGQGTFVSGTVQTENQSAPARPDKPVYLLGLSPTQIAHHSRVNWQPRLRRFQGIVDAAFRRGIMVQSDVAIDYSVPPGHLVEALSESGGLILHEESFPEEVLAGLAAKDVPMVAINCYVGVSYCSQIVVDSRRGALGGVNHLLALGHTRIAIICGEASRYSMGQRLSGYRDALGLAGIKRRPEYEIVEPRGSSEAAVAAFHQLLALPEPPTAIFAVSDRRALGILEEAKKIGLRVPEDLSVIGFDDLPEAEVSTPPLTTVHNPLFESGEAAIALLMKQRDEPSGKIAMEFMDAPLIIRGSTAKPNS